MAKYWVKMYTEILHDRKIRKLTDKSKLIYLQLILLAGQEDKDGMLPSVDDISVELDTTVNKVVKSLDELMSAGLIISDSEGNLFVHKFEQRQKENGKKSREEINHDYYVRSKEKKLQNSSENSTEICEKTEEKNPKNSEIFQKNDEKISENFEKNSNFDDKNSKNVGKNSKNEEKISDSTSNFRLFQTEIQTDLKDIDIDKELRVKNKRKEKEKEKELDKDSEEEINICASAQKEKNNSDPEKSEFWQFAKENAEMAEVFHKKTGLTPIKSQFGYWVNGFRDLVEAGISIDQMCKTISYMQSNNTPIASPSSLLKTAQWLKSRGSVPVKRNEVTIEPQKDRWDIAAENLNAKMAQMDYGNILALFGNSEDKVYDL